MTLISNCARRCVRNVCVILALLLAGEHLHSEEKKQNPSPSFGDPDFVWGANYVPSRRMTSYQVWWKFDPEQIDREIGYAKKLRLNALRMWLSYEYWLENPKEVEANFDKLLDIANKHGIRIVISLFSNCGGIPPIPDRLRDESPVTGVETISPAWSLIKDPQRWEEAYAFVDWFMARYKDDSRLLAIELINEPEAKAIPFAQGLLERASKVRGSVPLTIGCINFKDNAHFVDKGVDIMQSHPNFVSGTAHAEDVCRRAANLVQENGKPYWASEWQRIRQSALGWGGKLPVEEERLPGYASYCEILKKNNIQGFFWSLMVRPSFLKVSPNLRWFNGVFQEDGTVWSLEDARAISGDPNLDLTERKEIPEWAKDVKWRDDG